MAFQPGYKGYFALDNAAGSITNLQQYIDNASVPQSVDTPETTTLGTQAKSFIIGNSNGDQLTISGPYSAGLHTHITALIAAQAAGTASHSWIWGPGGSVSGEAKTSGECLAVGYTSSGAVGGRSEWTASLQVTGAVTNATW